LIGIFLVAISGWYYAGKALQPMSKIVSEVENIQPSDLSRRVDTGNNQDELARMAETFNNLLDRVERAFQMQRMFVSNVSHELKNPLTAIRAQLDVALQRDREPEIYRKALQSVLDDIQDLSETEQKLLYLARVYNSPQSIPLGPTRLDELLWQTMEQFKKQHPEYRASIEFGEMPESGDGLLVSANEPLLRLAILNLMSNACKYSPDQKVLIRAVFQPGGRHAIEVCDNGSGIPEAEKALIFEPFYRSPRHLTIKGTGIGLSLVKSILNLHQIDLSVESPKHGGSVFRLVFP
jgi:signal transduction histidine kinase